MADVNSRYSSGTVTPVQRGRFQPMTADGSYGAGWGGGVESVENAHDQQAAPTHALDGPVVANRTGTPAGAPVSDRDAAA